MASHTYYVEGGFKEEMDTDQGGFATPDTVLLDVVEWSQYLGGFAGPCGKGKLILGLC